MKTEVIYFKDRYGFYVWFLKHEQEENNAAVKTLADMKKDALRTLRRRNLAWQMTDIKFIKAR